MSSNSASTAAASSAKKQKRLRRLFRRTFNYFHGPQSGATTNRDETSSSSTSAAAATEPMFVIIEPYIYMGHETVPKNVTRVIVHESVTAIPEYAFQECRGLKEIFLPEGLLEIGHWAFRSCTSLVDIIFPSSLRVIPWYTFQGCKKLKKIVLPEGLREIGEWAFRNCTSLKDIHFPSTLRVIGICAFADCSLLVRADFNEGLQTIEDGAFSGCRSILHLQIPSTVTTIGNYAFRDCWALKDVQLCEGLLRIGSQAFQWCYSLLRINIPSSVTSISYDAFHDCNFLVNVTIAPYSKLEQAKLEQSHLLENLHQVGCTLDSVKGRFDDLPLHRICFHQTVSAKLLEEVREHAIMDRLTQQDCFEMTPLHILACSGRHDVEVYKLFDNIHPEALLIKDKWGNSPLMYAILGEAPQETIHLLFEKHRIILDGSLPFDFLVIVEELTKKKGTSAEFVRSLIHAQRTHFPTLEIEWERIVNGNVAGRMHVKMFRVLVEASVSKRFNCMSSEHQLAIDNMINAIDTDERSRVDGQCQWIIECIQDYVHQYREWLENATTVLELVLWNAAENATRREGATIDQLGPREECRVNCGAGVIIPLVLPFL